MHDSGLAIDLGFGNLNVYPYLVSHEIINRMPQRSPLRVGLSVVSLFFLEIFKPRILDLKFSGKNQCTHQRVVPSNQKNYDVSVVLGVHF